MKRYKLAVSLLLCVCLFGCAAKAPPPPKTNVPVSREGNIEDYTNPAEILVYATGIGTDTNSAILDARRAAVYLILSGGTDPLLQTPEEKNKFRPLQEGFFEASHIRNFISWEASAIKDRLKMADGRLKARKHFKVNKTLVNNWLIENGVKLERDELVEIPIMIMVIPEVQKGKDPVQTMNSNTNLRHAAGAIKSYLTALQYDVQVPEQMNLIQDISQAQEALEGMEEGYGYQLALAIGSDVYITYTTNIESRSVGGRTVRKANTIVKAFETTTARLLGEETGYSEERPAVDSAVVEEAVHGAIDKVLSRINAYWKKDLKRGIQYKLILRIEGAFDEDEREDIAFAISDLLKEFCNISKEVLATDMTLDYLVWVDSEKYSQSRDLYRDLRRSFPQEFRGGKISSININRKLLLLKITEAE